MNLLEQVTQPTPGYREIPLTQGQVAIVDVEDYDRLSQFMWSAVRRKDGKFYAVRATSRKTVRRHVLMHREIMGEPKGLDVDHRDGNGLNNRRLNLRVATHMQNCQNAKGRRHTFSGLKGVSFDSRKQKWRARISFQKKETWLGHFDTASQASAAYIEAAKTIHGDFACWEQNSERPAMTAPSGRAASRRKLRQAVQPADQSYRIILLTQGQSAIVDAQDFAPLSKFNWYAKWDDESATFYACRNVYGPHRGLSMHREIMQAPKGMVVDHRDGDGLNNRRHNLRLATYAQNRRNLKALTSNTSGHKGVYFHRKTRKWMAAIGHEGRQVYLGLFDSPEAASAAYVEAAKRLHGEFANW